MRKCKWCGKDFDPGHYPKGQVRRTKLCPECQAKIVIRKPRTCKGCGKDFILVATKKRHSRVYCDECLARFQQERQKKQEEKKLQREAWQHELEKKLEEKKKELAKATKAQSKSANSEYVGMGDIFDSFFGLLGTAKPSLDKKKEELRYLSSICAGLKLQIAQLEREEAEDKGGTWDSFVYNVLLQGKACEEDIKEFPHVVTSDGRMFGQCESCHKYVEEKKVGEGFDPSLHLCYDWENRRLLCPKCISRQVSPV